MKIYSSIDTLPITKYWSIVESGGLDELIYSGRIPYLPWRKKAALKRLYQAWDNIEIELYDFLVKDKDFVDGLKQKRRDILRKIKATLSKKPVDVLKWEATKTWQEQESPVDFDFHKSIAILENMSPGVAILVANEKLTTRKYLIHMNLMKENGSRQEDNKG